MSQPPAPLPKPGDGPGNGVKKNGLLGKSREMLQSAADSLTGRELPRLVEDFTREMSILAEGLSEDQAALREALRLQGGGQDELAQKTRAMEKQLEALTRRVDELARKAERRQKGEAGLARILRQATWLAAVVAAGFIVTALIRLFGR
jgi:predicted RNase H-like nuclease (RuvC/YqgF family)